MAHYAFIDPAGVVVEVVPGVHEHDDVNGITGTEAWEAFYATLRPGLECRRTSYNTLGGEHVAGGTPFRKNYAGIGYTFDPVRDAFVPPSPFPSWLLDEDTCQWGPPVPYPTDGGLYVWNETDQKWEAVNA